MSSSTAGSGTAEDPWILATPPGKSDFEAWRDEGSDPPALVVQVGDDRSCATSCAASTTCTRC